MCPCKCLYTIPKCMNAHFPLRIMFLGVCVCVCACVVWNLALNVSLQVLLCNLYMHKRAFSIKDNVCVCVFVCCGEEVDTGCVSM
jgi:hypothetical protein